MMTYQNLHTSLLHKIWLPALVSLYAPDGTQVSMAAAYQRALSVVEGLAAVFDTNPNSAAALFSAPGRTELGGNHTDHQHGHVLCAGVNLDMLACAAINGKNIIRIHSAGHPLVEVDLADLSSNPAETGTTTALVRGVASRFLEYGCHMVGFDVFILSDVMIGSGLSSSAAFEVLLGTIINHFFCGGTLSPVRIAKIGQYAENEYFGKPCGLMDQMACALGGAVAIDFKSPSSPAVTPIRYDFSLSGHALCIVDTGSCHDDLTADFTDITREMEAISAYFGKQYLREVPESDFRSSLPSLRSVCGDRAVLRALHFFREDKRAVAQAEALNGGDFPRFLALMNESGLSSSLLLQNTWSPSDPRRQAIPLALSIGRELLDGAGAIRVHGGGFAGTVQAFVPLDRLDAFRLGMDAVFGLGSCQILRIRPQGACAITR